MPPLFYVVLTAGVGEQVLLFPEGSCTNQSALLPFKLGAFVAGKPVQPVLIRFPFRFTDPSWPAIGPSLPALVFRMMAGLWQSVHIKYLPVVTPTEEEKAAPAVFAAKVRQVRRSFERVWSPARHSIPLSTGHTAMPSACTTGTDSRNGRTSQGRRCRYR